MSSNTLGNHEPSTLSHLSSGFESDLNPPTSETESNQTPPMDLTIPPMDLRQALRNFKKGIYDGMLEDEMREHILAEVYTRMLAMETSERLKDNLCKLWRCCMLRDAACITLNGLMEEVDFETGRVDDEEWEGKEWMRRFAEEGSVIDEYACDNAEVILKFYGLDQAMEDFYDEYVFQGEGDDRPRFDGFKNFLAYHCLRDTVFGLGCVMFEALQPPPPSFEIPKAPTSVGECVLCCDESSVLLTLPCGHAFGENCLQDWVDTKKRNKEPKTCPMCRQVFYTHEDLPSTPW